MSEIDWKTALNLLIASGGVLAYVALILELVLHFDDLKAKTMKPNFQLSMKTIPYRDGNLNTHIYVENPKTNWRVADATECRIRLRILSQSGQELKGTTPLRWEQTGNDFNQRISAGSQPVDSFALQYDPRHGHISVNVCQGALNTLSRFRQFQESVDIEVAVESKEKTVTKYVRGVKLPEQFSLASWPPFVNDC